LSSLYRELLDSGGHNGRPLSARSVDYVHAVLRKAFNDAVRSDQIMSSNPAERAKRPRRVVVQVKKEIWDARQVRDFLTVAARHRLYAFYWLAVHTGARRGELLNLRWADIDFGQAPAVTIRGSVGMADGRRVEGTTKGGRVRTVSIDPGTVATIKTHRSQQDGDRALVGQSWRPGDYVFCTWDGSPVYPDTPTALMAKMLREHNSSQPANPLPVVRLHDLRTSTRPCCSRPGWPVHVVSARLGHTDAAITLRVYAHVLGDQATSAATAFADALDLEAPDDTDDDQGADDAVC
jgi:integrase